MNAILTTLTNVFFAVIALLLAAIIYPVQFSKDMENGKNTFQLTLQ